MHASMCSPAYMAPEQLEGHVLTLKCDVWAVGINLWELATQKLPWAEEAMRESPNGLADYEYCRRKVVGYARSLPPLGGPVRSACLAVVACSLLLTAPLTRQLPTN